jgi:hypothetical protein
VLDLHDYVDLGLPSGTLWATCNVGAEVAEEYGKYYAWGETEEKDNYSWANYKWCKGAPANMTKNNTTDGLKTLLPEDDAAHVHWGGIWRMPTKDEMQELLKDCTWEEETRNSIKGHKVTGPNGNNIFIPIAGWYNYDLYGETLQGLGHSTYYSTSTLSPSNAYAYDLVFNDVSGTSDGISYNSRRCGFPIRPVCEP